MAGPASSSGADARARIPGFLRAQPLFDNHNATLNGRQSIPLHSFMSQTGVRYRTSRAVHRGGRLDPPDRRRGSPAAAQRHQAQGVLYNSKLWPLSGITTSVAASRAANRVIAPSSP